MKRLVLLCNGKMLVNSDSNSCVCDSELSQSFDGVLNQGNQLMPIWVCKLFTVHKKKEINCLLFFLIHFSYYYVFFTQETLFIYE